MLRKKLAVLVSFIAMLLLANPNAMAFQEYMNTVNTACGETVITDCSTCHYGITPSPEQEIYLSGDYCYFCPTSTVCPVPVTPIDEDTMLAEARQAINDFGTELMSEFMAAMQAGGPINAINVCSVIAPEIASSISRENGWMVRRVTRRARNPLSIPDSWEAKQLDKFAKKLAKGTPAAELEVSEITEESGDRYYYRYMKGIVIPPPDVAPCTLCHGDVATIDPAILEILNDQYPYDRATGYSPGDLRGAFSVKRPLYEWSEENKGKGKGKHKSDDD